MASFKKLFSQPLFWTNVITATVMLFLVGTIVFGWTNPTTNPPGGGGAISVISSGPDTGHVRIGDNSGVLRRIQNVAAPLVGANNVPLAGHENDTATAGWVSSLMAQVSGAGKTLFTLWGTCPSFGGTGAGGTCVAGDGTPTCSAVFGSTGVSEAYAGFGPFTYAERFGSANPVTYEAIDSIPICTNTSPNYPYLNYNSFWGNVGNNPAHYSAGWPGEGPYQYANTCRVCILQ